MSNLANNKRETQTYKTETVICIQTGDVSKMDYHHKLGFLRLYPDTLNRKDSNVTHKREHDHCLIT